MSKDPIIKIRQLGFPWETSDPFLFCVHHLDAYPVGNENMGPDASFLKGRNIGQDFTIKNGWRMYHGETIPGFPVHPHRGFETVTIVKKGIVDHADSLGATARFGNGDVQWLTAGKGIQHSEMFPLLNQEKENSFELFQIWLNLPKAKKFSQPHFSMLWGETIPTLTVKDKNDKKVEVKIVAGKIGDLQSPPSAPDSWAADPDNEVAIWTIKMEANSHWALPASINQVNRTLYFFKGESISIEGQKISAYQAMDLQSNQSIIIENGSEDSEFLMLQGKPINEPVVQYGPFVMNTELEIQQAFSDYQKTQFGGWPWSSSAHVHARENGRFARHANGLEEFK